MSDAREAVPESTPDARAAWAEAATPAHIPATPTEMAEIASFAPSVQAGEESPDTRDGTLISFGISVEDRFAKRVTIQVFVLAVSIGAFSVIHFILNLMMGSYAAGFTNPRGRTTYSTDRLWSNLAGLIIELAIPAAGYLGALYHNRQLTCCFCSCNLSLVFISSWSFISLALRQGELDGKCYREIEDQQRALCWMWLDDGAHKWVFIGDIVCSLSLSCCAAIASIRLFQKLSKEPPNIESTPVVGEVVHLRENTPLTRVNQAYSHTPSGQEVPLYTIDRTSTISNPEGEAGRRSVPRASTQSNSRPPSVRIELAPPPALEDEY